MVVVPITPEALAELEQKHGRVAVVRHAKGAYELVLRKPKRLEYKAFRANARNPATQADAQEHLVRMLIVHPEAATANELLEEWPGIPEACTKAVEELSGIAVDEIEK